MEKTEKKTQELEKMQRASTKQMQQVTQKLTNTDEAVEELQQKCNKLERFSRQNNIRVIGRTVSKGENCFSTVENILKEKFGLENVKIERAHPDGPKKKDGDGIVLQDEPFYFTDDLTVTDLNEKRRWREKVSQAYEKGVRYTLYIDKHLEELTAVFCKAEKDAQEEVEMDLDAGVTVRAGQPVRLMAYFKMETRSTELLSDWENNKPSPAQPAKMKGLRKGGVKCKARVRRQSLDNMQTQLKNMPSSLRQHSSYDNIARVVKSYQKTQLKNMPSSLRQHSSYDNIARVVKSYQKGAGGTNNDSPRVRPNSQTHSTSTKSEVDEEYRAQGQEEVTETPNQQIWLGGLFVPEAFITATRQYVSQANSWSLEELAMEVHISDGSGKDIPRDGGTFMVTTTRQYVSRANSWSLEELAMEVHISDGSGKDIPRDGGTFMNQQIWLGGLFVPEAFITATRQYVSQANSWSLEELAMEVHISDGSGKDIPRDGGTFMNQQIWLGGLFVPEAFITATRQYVSQANSWSLEELAMEVHISDGSGKDIPRDGGTFMNQQIWLGGLFVPEAFITATRQYVSQANSWPLEELAMEVHISDGSGKDIPRDGGTFMVTGTALMPTSRVVLIHRECASVLCRQSLEHIPGAKPKYVHEPSPKNRNIERGFSTMKRLKTPPPEKPKEETLNNLLMHGGLIQLGEDGKEEISRVVPDPVPLDHSRQILLCGRRGPVRDHREQQERLQKHFKKMFAGVDSIVLNEDATLVKGLSSKEGQELSVWPPGVSCHVRQHSSYDNVSRVVKSYQKCFLPEIKDLRKGGVKCKARVRRQSLDNMQTQLKNMPSSLRQHSSYDNIARVVKSYQKTQLKNMPSSLRQHSSYDNIARVVKSYQKDLLEIIGNSENVARLQKHFKKMFAGVDSIVLRTEGKSLLIGDSNWLHYSCTNVHAFLLHELIKDEESEFVCNDCTLATFAKPVSPCQDSLEETIPKQTVKESASAKADGNNNNDDNEKLQSLQCSVDKIEAILTSRIANENNKFDALSTRLSYLEAALSKTKEAPDEKKAKENDIEVLKNRIKSLEAENKNLRNRITALEKKSVRSEADTTPQTNAQPESSHVPAEKDTPDNVVTPNVPTSNRFNILAENESSSHDLPQNGNDSNKQQNNSQTQRGPGSNQVHDESQTRAEIVIIGDSNTRGIIPSMLYPENRVQKLSAMTIPQAKQLIKSTTYTDPKCILYHVGTNDIKQERAANGVTENLRQLVMATHDLYPNAAIVMSSVPPRNDQHLMEVTRDVNSFLHILDQETSYISVANNNNLEDGGSVKLSLYRHDGFHLNKGGIKVLAANWKTAIHPTVGLGIYTRGKRNPTSTQPKIKQDNRTQGNPTARQLAIYIAFATKH
ncbi:G-protein coupled receptor [Branchiostoma belcheri]|nr:G-protein coupled receptor [Branchiostoma belcheri]